MRGEIESLISLPEEPVVLVLMDGKLHSWREEDGNSRLVALAPTDSPMLIGIERVTVDGKEQIQVRDTQEQQYFVKYDQDNNRINLALAGSLG
ncbi:hypothetical protein L3I75_000922 [Vibrio vulnificus]|uniref:hypothetical protein n=1 Tax=Vibrio vulnificus TaxID=672 RepID=UPI0013026E29|nr:hypothetical protein [Vibrio vulnificus]EIU7614558.1 hypothetical protein [Vibrio vulnificus]EIU7861839.1 hypothetical protein [Vibrio vulnificus]EJE8579104.1 hypothetical protein [Vibrio vulnificus]MCU8204949.1 hypothetical protein [Vibrio vulnificus]HAS8423312.1 hypothetical protein [Vibrio vulnificus]